MSLSIIIPCLNEGNNLLKLLPYLRRYSSDKTEIIVIDASESNDNAEDICKDFEVQYHRCTACQRAKQLNQGARLSKRNLLFFVHADVLPPITFEDDIIDALSTFDFGLFAYQFDISKWYLNANANATKYKGLFCGGGDQCHFISKDTFLSMNGYNEQYSIMEDFEFYDRLHIQNKKIKLVQSRATVSTRKYQNNSYLRINLVNLSAYIMYKLRLAPARIKRFCSRWLR